MCHIQYWQLQQLICMPLMRLCPLTTLCSPTETCMLGGERCYLPLSESEILLNLYTNPLKLRIELPRKKTALRTCYLPLGPEEHNKQTPSPAATLNS